MSLQVQDIVNATSIDMRKVIGSSGSDATLMIGWVDRIHKDALHTSLFNNLSQKVVSQATTAGTSLYVLGVSDIRRILTVFDRTFNRVLMPMDTVAAPQALGEQMSPPAGSPPEEQLRPKVALAAKTMGLYPEYYRFVGNTNLYIFPAPATAYNGTLEIHYESQLTTLANLTDVLTIPDDGKDLVVAGVNMLALLFLKMHDEAAMWANIYDRAKKGELVV